MKIAILAPFWKPPKFEGGVSRVIFELRKEWLAAGHSVHIYSPQTQTDIAQGIYHIAIPRMPLYSVWINAYLILSGKLKSYDIIFPQSAAQALFLDKNRCVPFVHTLSNVEEKSPWRPWRYLIPWLEKKALRNITACLTLSDDTVEALCASCEVPAENIHKIQNGVDFYTFRPSIKGEKQPFTVFTAGRFIPRKRFELLIRAFALVVKHHSATRLIIAGGGKLEAQLKSLVVQLGLKQNVSFPGMLNQEQMLECYQRSQVFVLPSEAEGMPMVVLEAQACGLPVVIGNFSAAADIVQHGRTGFIAESNDPEEWAEYLDKLICSEILCEEFGIQARADVVTSFGWNSIAAQIEAVFQQFISDSYR